VRYSRDLLEAMLRFLRDKLEEAGSGKGTDGEEVARRRTFPT